MRLFSVLEAKHYCSSFIHSVGDSERALSEFQDKHLLNKCSSLLEGTTLFDEYRDCLLRNIERGLFLSASNYRRALDLMISSASPWAHVTLYYGTWHAAHALLGLFGCAICKEHVIDVELGQPGNQKLRIRKIGSKIGQENTTYRGSHQRFWDLFYQAFQPILPTFPSSLQPALSPIGGDRMWQISKRNEINYDTFKSITLAQDFNCVFNKANFPICLPGEMNTQYKIFELLIEMSYYYASDFGISTDALDGINAHMPLGEKVKALIYDEKPCGLVKKTRKSKIF
jgi:hypothetical protein